MAALATGHTVDTGIGNVVRGGRLFLDISSLASFISLNACTRATCPKLAHLTLSFPKANFAPQSLAWDAPVRKRWLSPGNAAARLAGLNSIYAFGSSAGIPFFIACDSSPPVKPESFAILKFENNPNDGFNVTCAAEARSVARVSAALCCGVIFLIFRLDFCQYFF
ncbi:hypothetical protein K3G39_18185 [Pontibacter sp. HSC-14F20]|uniref:hypothetical protein n=1 Tax=Pontibacter sp. HSC-14F20 TaxID=2864136 RepID=UPI001C73DE5B|nr:hypothetical protein [Pontibacter sp. HSC-14F20]MBX0335168.1 hypothetical protein [Pontibacter sp. HSC-14F20]